MTKKLTNEIIDQRLINRNIKRKTNYTHANDKNMLWECLVCGYGNDPDEPWRTSYSSIYQGYNCLNCAGMAPLTNKRIDQRLKQQNRDHIIARFEDSRGSNYKIKWKCLINNKHFWDATPNKILDQKHGCPKCNGGVVYTNQYVDKQLIASNKLIKRRTDYINNDYNKTEWECLICGYGNDGTWKTSWNSIKSFGCIKCIKCSKFIQKANIKHSNKYEYSKFIYFGYDVLGIIICSKHGEFDQTPNLHLKGFGCQFCSGNKKINERKIKNTLKKNNIQFEKLFLKIKINNEERRVFPDFYIRSLNLIIEYNGHQHYGPVRFGGISEKEAKENFKYQKSRDRQLRQYCKDNNINLLEIDGRKYFGTNLINHINHLIQNNFNIK